MPGDDAALPWPDHAAMIACSRRDPDRFWLAAAAALDWHVAPRMARASRANGHADWFPDGRLNSCFNALDRHVRAGAGDRVALIWDSPVSGGSARLTYATLLHRVEHFAGALRDLGVGPGDRVLISMPNLPEAVIAMLATARLGAVHVVVFAGFGAAELAQRIDAVRPRVMVTASCFFSGRHMVDGGATLAEAFAACRHPPASCVVLQRPGSPVTLGAGRDHDFAALEAAATPVAAVPVASGDPLYILHTSGTTGQAKGVVREHGGHAAALCLSMRVVYDAGPGDVVFSSSDLGWVVGHSYGVWGPLLAGATSLLYEGAPTGTPDAGAYWRLCAAHRVKILLTAPTALRAMRRHDPAGMLSRAHDLAALRSVFVAGERSEPELLAWTAAAARAPTHDHWWQTETGWPIAGTCRGVAGPVPEANGAFPQVSPGFDLCAVDVAGRPVAEGEAGELALRLPLPPGCLTTLWEDEAGFTRTYLGFPGLYRSFDLGSVDAQGRVRVLSRTDDVLKIAGRRIAGGAIEAVISAHPAVAECAVVGTPDRLRGQRPAVFVVLHHAADGLDDAALLPALNRLLQARIGAFVRLRAVWCCDGLPKTRSGKILRRALAARAADLLAPTS